MLMLSTYILQKRLIVDHGILVNKLKKSELMVKSVCGYTIFYQTDNNVMPSIDQHQVKLKQGVAYPKRQC